MTGRAVRRGAVALGWLLSVATWAFAEPATYENLLLRARHLIEEAERAWKHETHARAVELARQAMTVLETAEGIRRDDLRAPFLGVQAAVFASDPDAAGTWLDRFEQRNLHGDRMPAVHYVRALVDFRLRARPDLALRSLDRMLALDPAAYAAQREILYYGALVAEGEARLGAQEYDLALRHFRAAADLGRRRGERSKEFAALNSVGVVFQSDKRWAEAEEVFADLVRREPRNPHWHWRLGVNFANQNRWEEAIPHYEQVLRLVEVDGGAALARDELSELRSVYLRLGNSLRNVAAGPATPASRRVEMLERAREHIARYQELMPRDVRGHYWMGVLLYLDLERPYEAIPHFRRAYELDPACDHSLRQLVQIHAIHDPPSPPGGGSPDEAARAAWRAELERLRSDEKENQDARAKERERRERGPNRNAGCE